MKKAVISIGQKQYLVRENQELDVDHLTDISSKSIEFEPLLIIDGENVSIGEPKLAKNKVSATITTESKQAEKTLSVRYKAKKRVHTVRGNRRQLSTIKIVKIS